MAGITAEDLRRILRANGHSLVMSFFLFCELTTPMWNPNANAVVTRTLNRLEEFPLEWLDAVQLPNKEVRNGLTATREDRDYAPVDPFVRNFLDTLAHPPPEARQFINFSLAEAAFQLRAAGNFDPRRQGAQHVHTYRALMEEERGLAAALPDRHLARQQLLARKVVERIRRERLYDAVDANNVCLFEEVGRRVAQNPQWCPGLRVVFEVFHSLVDNLGDQLQDGDLGDMTHLYALPYVDVFVSDRRMAHYVEVSCRRVGLDLHRKIRRRLRDVIPELQ